MHYLRVSQQGSDTGKIIGLHRNSSLCSDGNIELAAQIHAIQPVPAGSVQIDELRRAFVRTSMLPRSFFIIVCIIMTAMVALQSKLNLAPILFDFFVCVDQLSICIRNKRALGPDIKVDRAASEKRFNISLEIGWEKELVLRRKPPLPAGPLQEGQQESF
jgi:hypothetical protein